MSIESRPVVRDYFGTQFRAFRLNAGISQEQLADDLGLSVNTVSRIENGQTSADLSTIYRFAQMMNISIDLLFPPNKEQMEHETDMDISELTALYKQLTNTHKIIAEKTMRTLLNSLLENQFSA